VRDFEFQHHDGDEDGDDAITEGFQAVFTHALSLRPMSTVARQAYQDNQRFPLNHK
jgi:hypothetical protein